MSLAFEYLLHITGPQTAQTLSLPPGTSTIGRQAGSAVWLNDPQVSRSHARIECTEVECILTDTGSANGTFLNGEKLTPQAAVLFKPGDRLAIGPFELSLEQIPLAESPVEEAKPAEVASPPPTKPDTAEPVPPSKKALPKAKEAAGPPEAPPPPPQPPPGTYPIPQANDLPTVDDLIQNSRWLLSFLPGIYDTPFMENFLRVFESILRPIEWNIGNFDLFLDPGTAPTAFLPWLSSWYQLIWGPDWSEAQRRAFLKDAHLIYARRGTRWALSRTLEIYLGVKPEIIDLADDLAPHTFRVRLPLSQSKASRLQIEALIDAHKPAYTTYALEFGLK